MRGRNRRAGEDGFSLPELMIALGILSVCTMLLSAGLASSLRPLSLSKQRSAAVYAAQQALELARSLSFANLGLSSTDGTLDTDPDVSAAGADRRFGGGCPSQAPCEVVQYANNTANHPFVPHTTSFRRGPTTLTRSIYVTAADGTSDLKRVTVRVEWSNPAVRVAANMVRLSTLVSSTASTGTSTALTGTVAVNSGNAIMSSAIGSGQAPETVLMTGAALAPPLVDQSISPLSVTGCGARGPGIQAGTGGSLDGAVAMSFATNDPFAPQPVAGSRTVPVTTTGNPSPDVASWIAQSTAPTAATCFSSLLGQNGASGGDSERTYGFGSAGWRDRLTFQRNTSTLGTVKLLDLRTQGTTDPDVSGTTATDPQDTITATAKRTIAETQIMVMGPDAPVAATYGLVRIEPVTLTATAAGTLIGVPATSPSITGGPIRISVYDPLAAAAGCAPPYASSGTLGYCVVERALATSLSFDFTGQSQGIVYHVVLTGDPVSITSETGDWEATAGELLHVNVHMCATTASDCGVIDQRSVDLTTELSVGSLYAKVVRGVVG